MNEHPQLEETFEEYALGALGGPEDEERRSFEAHVKGCAECSRRLETARSRLALLALAAPAATPDASAKARLMQKISSERSPATLPRRRKIFWIAPALAAAAVVLAVIAGFLAARNRQLGRRISELQATQARQAAEMSRARAVLDILTSPATLRVSLSAAPARTVPQGKAFYNPRKGLLFYAANLPALPPDRTYQLWLVPAQGKPISAGIFAVDARGNGEVLLPPLPVGIAAQAFAVTVEPAGGKPQPTGTKVLIGAVS